MARRAHKVPSDKLPQPEQLSEEQEQAREFRRANAAYRQDKLQVPKHHEFLPFLRSQLAHILTYPGLTPTDKVVCLTVAMHTSPRHGEAVALTIADIAAGAGLKARATQDAIKTLQSHGLLGRVFFHGKNRAANYYLIPPGESPAVPDSEEA